MSPTGNVWFSKLLQGQRKTPVKSTTKAFLSSSAPSTLDEQSMMTESKPGTSLDVLGTPRIFALVVAIDRYKNPDFNDLTGCRNDGKRFINFLTGVLGVPSSQIMFLANEEATRAEILKQFNQFLIHNAYIQRDDAIVFYFAGHGSQFPAPPGWVADSNKIETLCPYDVRKRGDGNEIWDIPDRTIDALMRKLASEKGDNVVAVFDCCHSGGLSRSKTLRVRSIPSSPYPPPADLDREIWSSVPEPGARSAKTVLQSGFRYKAMESHVLLAACSSDEVAFEDPDAKDAPGGLFTTALIECLRRCSVHDTTYSRLFEMLVIKQKDQNPQCEGTNTDRLLFSVNTIRDGETTFRVSKKGNKLWVSAGSVHGVVEGTQFTVTSFTQTSDVKAKKVGAFQTVLESSPSITDGRATVSNWNHPTLRVHSPIPCSSSRITVVPTDEPADVALHRIETGQWMAERFDSLILMYAGRAVHLGADIEQHIGDVLDAIANFNSCLYRLPGAPASFSGKVKMRLNRIGVIQNEIGPVGDDLLDVPQGTGLKEATIRELDEQYCLTLENFSKVDLFPYFFYFDPSDYSVQSWYKPSSLTMPAPLKQINEDGTPSLFAFGYGGFGTDPIEFYLPPEQEVDSGFLRVFLTTTYVDMRNVSQLSITEILSSSRGSMYTLKGAWTCETFVLTCKKS